MGKNNDSICIKLAETDEELCGRGYVHFAFITSMVLNLMEAKSNGILAPRFQ